MPRSPGVRRTLHMYHYNVTCYNPPAPTIHDADLALDRLYKTFADLKSALRETYGVTLLDLKSIYEADEKINCTPQAYYMAGTMEEISNINVIEISETMKKNYKKEK